MPPRFSELPMPSATHKMTEPGNQASARLREIDELLKSQAISPEYRAQLEEEKRQLEDTDDAVAPALVTGEV